MLARQVMHLCGDAHIGRLNINRAVAKDCSRRAGHIISPVFGAVRVVDLGDVLLRPTFDQTPGCGAVQEIVALLLDFGGNVGGGKQTVDLELIVLRDPDRDAGR